MAEKKILTIDGGGVFGLIPATLFADFSPYAMFDAFTGTSIGAAIAAYYACGLDPAKLPALMMDAFPGIFTAPWYRHCWAKCSEYPSEGLKKFLNQTFGDMRLGHVQKPLYIVSFDFSNRIPKVYSSIGEQDKDILVADAVLASVSAPTYFPPSGNCVDGGLWANNPSIVGAAGVTNDFNMEMNDISVFSVGTGSFPDMQTDMSCASSWGIAEWGLRIIPAMLQATVTGFEFIAAQMPFKAYCRWNKVWLKASWAMDDTLDLQAIIDVATAMQYDFDASLNQFMQEADA